VPSLHSLALEALREKLLTRLSELEGRVSGSPSNQKDAQKGSDAVLQETDGAESHQRCEQSCSLIAREARVGLHQMDGGLAEEDRLAASHPVMPALEAPDRNMQASSECLADLGRQQLLQHAAESAATPRLDSSIHSTYLAACSQTKPRSFRGAAKLVTKQGSKSASGSTSQYAPVPAYRQQSSPDMGSCRLLRSSTGHMERGDAGPAILTGAQMQQAAKSIPRSSTAVLTASSSDADCSRLGHMGRGSRESALSLSDLRRPVVVGNAALYANIMRDAGLDSFSRKRNTLCSISASGQVFQFPPALWAGSASCEDENDVRMSSFCTIHLSEDSHHHPRASASSHSLAIGDDGMCPVCLGEGVCVEITACKHTLCFKCARKLSTLEDKLPICPLCRRVIADFVECSPKALQ
jgi:hypothetical protein